MSRNNAGYGAEVAFSCKGAGDIGVTLILETSPITPLDPKNDQCCPSINDSSEPTDPIAESGKPGTDGIKPIVENLGSSGSTGSTGSFTQTTLPSGTVNPITGNKEQNEEDYVSNNPVGLNFRRTYSSNSIYVSDVGMGLHWRHNYARSLIISAAQVIAKRSNGQEFIFTSSGGNWTPDADVADRLIQTTTGWRYVSTNNLVEDYDAVGKLVSIKNRNGLTKTLFYNVSVAGGGDGNPNTLDRVSNSFGQVLVFQYDTNGHIATIIDPAGESYHYTYDATGRLIAVAYPDHTPTDSTDNPTRLYHYENANLPNALTGITDEKGVRFLTWSYDAVGRVISSERAGGANKVTMDYSFIDDIVDPRVTVTNALGKKTTYHYTTLFGARRVTQVERHPTANHVGSNQNNSYDANGYLDRVTDWNGNITDYDHDVRGLEINRVEAQGMPSERTISTTWDPNFRVPTQIDTFDKNGTHLKNVSLTYNASGLLIARQITDIKSGQSRITTYSYNALGLLASIDGPRTDVNDITNFTYNASGDLIRVTNALGHTNRFSNYNASGRP